MVASCKLVAHVGHRDLQTVLHRQIQRNSQKTASGIFGNFEQDSGMAVPLLASLLGKGRDLLVHLVGVEAVSVVVDLVESEAAGIVVEMEN